MRSARRLTSALSIGAAMVLLPWLTPVAHGVPLASSSLGVSVQTPTADLPSEYRTDPYLVSMGDDRQR